MLKVGLTGGIGAGKSLVAGRLGELGAVVIDADALARAVLAPGTPGLSEVAAVFGTQVLTPQGTLDRAALAGLVFNDAVARSQLNRITHPRIAALTLEAFAAAPPDSVVVHDVPLLVENAMSEQYDLVVVVYAPAELRVQRLVQTRGMTPDDAWSRVNAQADDAARRAVADVWLDNTRSPADVVAEVDQLWFHRLVPLAARSDPPEAPA